MTCKHCGYEIDTKKRRHDGSIQCPNCKAVYRPRTKSPTPAAKPVKKDNSFAGIIKSIPWKKKIWKFPLWAWVVASLCIVGIIGNITDDGGNTAIAPVSTVQGPTSSDSMQSVPTATETVASLATASPTEQPTPTAEAVIDNPFEYAASQTMKDNYTVENHEDGNIYVRYLIDGISVEWIIKDFKYSATNYCKYLSLNFPQIDYTSIHFTGYCAALDMYGNSLFQDSARLTIDKSSVDKINWDKFVFDNISSIGYDYVLGSLLKE